jgi:hypothetical protein
VLHCLCDTAFSDRFSAFSANLHVALSKILDRSQNALMSASDSTPKVKSMRVGIQKMINLKALSNAAFTTVAVLSLGIMTHAASAQAQSIQVTRGSHGAISLVDAVPVGATVLPTTPSQSYPKLVTRGPGGAAHIVSETAETKPMAQFHSSPKLMTRGSHGAAYIVNRKG